MSRSSGARGSSAGVLAAFVAALTVVLLACGHDSTSPAASTVSIASGDTQKVFVGGSAAQPLVVLLAGADGAPLSGEMVTWAVTSGGGSLNPVTSTTDDSGHARTTYISADSADTAIVTATAAQGSAKFRIVVAADTTGTLTATDGEGTAVLVGYQISLVVQARDQFGNAVPGRVVTWTSSGGILRGTTSTTDSKGQATIVFTVGPATGRYTVEATANGFTPVSFTVSGV